MLLVASPVIVLLCRVSAESFVMSIWMIVSWCLALMGESAQIGPITIHVIVMGLALKVVIVKILSMIVLSCLAKTVASASMVYLVLPAIVRALTTLGLTVKCLFHPPAM
jgi:hypothetical protein